MNHFIKITDNGGYIGRWYWTNSGIHRDLPPFGQLCFLPRNILNTGWAGDIWAIRAICK